MFVNDDQSLPWVITIKTKAQYLFLNYLFFNMFSLGFSKGAYPMSVEEDASKLLLSKLKGSRSIEAQVQRDVRHECGGTSKTFRFTCEW